MGWVLAGFDLEIKPARHDRATPTRDARGLATALTIAAQEKIAMITVDDLVRSAANYADSLSYRIDVRSEQEFVSGHIAGTINVPGGQAVQRADDFVPVRNAPIVFISNQSARAVMAAYWYRQMGFKNVFFLQGGLDAWSGAGQQLSTSEFASDPLGFAAARASARFIDAAQLHDMIEQGSHLLLDVSTSVEHESAHVPGANWISRGWIDIKLPELIADRANRIILTCTVGVQSTFAAQQLARVGYSNISVLDGGLRAWTAAGYRTDSGLSEALAPANDVVLSPSIRGNKQDMQKYLAWELKLKH
jgi:rhodanese-related sulfurtransferase